MNARKGWEWDVETRWRWGVRGGYRWQTALPWQIGGTANGREGEYMEEEWGCWEGDDFGFGHGDSDVFVEPRRDTSEAFGTLSLES